MKRVREMSLSSRFMSDDIDQRILIDIASWSTSTFIIRLESLSREESTTSFINYAISTSFEKSTSSSRININLIKYTSNTRIDESIR